MALLDDGDLEYMRATQAEARPTEAQLIRQGARGRTPTGGRLDGSPEPEDTPVAIRIDNDPNPPEPLAVEHGIHLVRITADMVKIEQGDTLKVSATEEYRVVSHGDMDPWTTAQRLWAVRVVRGA